MSKRCKPHIKLVDGEWYAFAPNNSPISRALLARAIGVLHSWNERRLAAARRAKKNARAAAAMARIDDMTPRERATLRLQGGQEGGAA